MLSIIIPVYNESKIIQRNLSLISSALRSTKLKYEIIVVDDGSEDDTFSEAKKSSKKDRLVKSIRYANHRGKGKALLYGFRHSRGHHIVFYDADLEIPPKSIFYLLAELKSEDTDIAIFSKNHPSSEINFPFYRKLLSRGYYLLTKLLFRLPVNDTQTGCKIFRRNVLSSLSKKVVTKRFAFDLEILAYANRLGFSILELPIKIKFKRQKSRISIRNVFDLILDTLVIFYRIYILRIV